MLADAGNDNAGSLTMGFAHHYVGHDGGVVVIKMAYWFVNDNKVERLCQRSDHRHTLLLTKRHVANLCIELVGNAKTLKPLFQHALLLKACQVVLYCNILPSRELGKQAQLLKQIADVSTAQVYPLVHRQGFGAGRVKEHAPVIVVTIAHDVAAKRALALAAISFHEVEMALAEAYVFALYLRTKVCTAREDMRHNSLKTNLFHFLNKKSYF